MGKLRAWIDRGAAWPAEADAETPRSTHWAFQPVKHPAPPPVWNRSWAVNPIDRFILARLEQQGIRPSPPADRVTLLRRLHLDLTGLPPSPEEVGAFLGDHRPGAYERVVDRLLASPAYGERWARHWLDLARYADSNGYTVDGPRQMWLYRDWVIRAFNSDMPFDRFTVEQLAGDLLPGAGDSQKIATGFHRNTLINEEGGADPEQFRNEAVVDRVNTTGAVWLGLTVGCAQCHTHKYDPITQREYYQLFAFFNSQDEPTLSFPSPEQAREKQEIAGEIAAARKELADWDRAHSPAADNKDPARQQIASRLNQLQAKEKAVVAAIPTTMVLQERAQPRETFVHLRGDFLRRGATATPGVLSVLPPLPSSAARPNRLDLARWLVDPKNPLTARVTVNRYWQQLFGKGLVETENDFGTQGSPPTHPELLDWLAAEFSAPSGSDPYACGWSMKRLHRLIVTSAVYRQSSHDRPELRETDPGNKLLARQNRLRLDAEIIRDCALAASGLLSRKIGGPSVFPPQPAGLDLLTQVKRNWTASKGEDRYRRGLYTWHWRSNQYPLFATFDAPNASTACTRRARSNTPLQSLMLANDESFLEMARALAARLLRDSSGSDTDRLRRAFRLCLSREPTPPEAERLTRYYRSQLARFQSAPADASAAAPELPGVDAPHAAAWTAV
ncbi:MAG TPA: DUF1549 and DUF1553 domain-containing protein, partial [Armatimonadota bacterium]|nr:DUF1549 and DUF1553 domain-containing protein [Armatimonadota bacterium]